MRARLQFWLTQSQWRYCAAKGLLRICNPQKHNHDVQQADCFDLKAGEEDESHILFEMTPNACASLLSEQARQGSRKKDSANDKVAAVVDDVLSKSNETGKRSQPPRQYNLPRADASTPSKAIINVEDDDIDDSDNDMDSAISARSAWWSW